MRRPRNPLLSFLFILALVLPWLMFLFRPGGSGIGHVLFWLAFLLSLLLLWTLSAKQRRVPARLGPDLGPRMLNEAEQPEIVRQLMDVKIAIRENGVQLFRGPLRESASATFEKLNLALGESFVSFVQEDEQLGTKIVLIPKRAEEEIPRKPVRPWLHWLLFGLTVVTTTWAGASHQGVDLAQEPGRFIVGLPYSIGLLLILGVHELGHFFMARRHAMDVTPPLLHSSPLRAGYVWRFYSNAIVSCEQEGPL